MKYFSIDELTRSSTAQSRGIDNIPDADQILNMRVLIEECLDKVRELNKGPIIVNSGFRSKALNESVGGSKTSDHMTGCAADITVGSPEKNRILFEKIKLSDIDFNQLIDEKDCRWIHISYKKGSNKRQVLYL